VNNLYCFLLRRVLSGRGDFLRFRAKIQASFSKKPEFRQLSWIFPENAAFPAGRDLVYLA